MRGMLQRLPDHAVGQITQRWFIGTRNAGGIAVAHPFHIHVNPFQLQRTGPDGKPETIWKDTLLVPPSSAQQPIKVYTRYLDYIGQFVMHCHILDHEDLGMMEVDEVVTDAGGAGFGVHRHH